MVARIKVGSSINRGFFYNENKVEEGVAECIMAQNYPADLDHMSQHQRLHILKKVASLNEDIKANTIHISLNFDPSEQLSNEQLKEIATLYMERIGFGGQPFLVYRHYDAGHPHIHILTIKTGLDGKGINTHNLGKNESEVARKELEERFGLVKAEAMKAGDYTLKPAYVQKVKYGRSESRKAISLVLEGVLKSYKYGSLPELNAVLNQYNVMADRGGEQSRIFKNNGLVYRILDEQGKPVGVPIKASSFYNKPGLKFLQERFSHNEKAREPHKSRVKNAIDFYFINQEKPSLADLIKELREEGIHSVLRQNESGLIYGITYVDHQSKCVFNGSTLGKNYSAKAITERCGLKSPGSHEQPSNHIEQVKDMDQRPSSYANDQVNEGLLQTLLQQEYDPNYVPYELSGKKKRRKKR